jgi:hypothetical protein
MKPKVLIVILVVLVLILVVGMVLGPALEGKRGRNRDILAWVRKRSGLLQRRVSRQDLQASPATCVQDNYLVVSPGQRCRVDIRRADENVRTLELTLDTGARVNLALEHRDPSQGLNVNAALEERDSVKLQIYDRGATLTLADCSAGSGQPCRLRAKTGK